MTSNPAIEGVFLMVSEQEFGRMQSDIANTQKDVEKIWNVIDGNGKPGLRDDVRDIKKSQQAHDEQHDALESLLRSIDAKVDTFIASHPQLTLKDMIWENRSALLKLVGGIFGAVVGFIALSFPILVFIMLLIHMLIPDTPDQAALWQFFLKLIGL